MKKNWHAVYTRPGCERKVAESFNRRKFLHYCPLNRKSKNGSSKLVAEPLFKSFVFVKASIEELPIILTVEGVVNFVYWHDTLAIVNETEIDLMRSFVDHHMNLTFERITVNPEEAARFINRSILVDGDPPTYHENKTVKAIMPSIGYMLIAEATTASGILYLQRHPTEKKDIPPSYSIQ